MSYLSHITRVLAAIQGRNLRPVHERRIKQRVISEFFGVYSFLGIVLSPMQFNTFGTPHVVNYNPSDTRQKVPRGSRLLRVTRLDGLALYYVYEEGSSVL